MNMNSYGDVIQKEWFFNANNRPYMELYQEEFIVMPNHIHGIIWIMVGEGARTSGESNSRMIIKTNSHGPSPSSLGAIIGQYKSITTKQINKTRKSPGGIVWQRNYYDHIIRNDKEFHAVRLYIQNNSIKWEEDRNFQF